MKISTEISSFRPYGENRDVLRLLKEGGFDAYDFSMFRGDRERLIDEPHYLRGAEKLREYGEFPATRRTRLSPPFGRGTKRLTSSCSTRSSAPSK